MNDIPEKDALKEANALIDYIEQSNGVGDPEIYEVSFDIENWKHYAAEILGLVRRAQKE